MTDNKPRWFWPFLALQCGVVLSVAAWRVGHPPDPEPVNRVVNTGDYSNEAWPATTETNLWLDPEARQTKGYKAIAFCPHTTLCWVGSDDPPNCCASCLVVP